jgi:hypothetical protein
LIATIKRATKTPQSSKRQAIGREERTSAPATATVPATVPATANALATVPVTASATVPATAPANANAPVPATATFLGTAKRSAKIDPKAKIPVARITNVQRHRDFDAPAKR